MARNQEKEHYVILSVIIFAGLVGLFLVISDGVSGMFSVGGKSRKFIADAANFNNPFTGNAVEETTRLYGYVDAPYYGRAPTVATDSYRDNTKSEITQVYTLPIIRPHPTSSPETSRKVAINNLEELKAIICPGYTVEQKQEYKVSNGQTQISEPSREKTTVTYKYDDSGKLNTIEPMGGKSRRFAADAG
ncbi:hypothetical protein HY837_04835 [archaeon]|nr:hypothetical protein [archaeon]